MQNQVPKNWQKVKLGETGYEVRNLYEPTQNEALPYVGLEHIEQQSLRLLDAGLSSETQSTKKKFLKEDILFGTLRPYFRKVVIPKFNGVCSTDITVLRAKSGYDQKYLFYFIANEQFINYATSSSNGTRMPRANWKTISKSEWYYPSLPIQQKISSILSAYDDLIENNNKQIKILEEMAQAIFKEWFICFRFPLARRSLGEGGGYEKIKMIDSPLGKIPEGWQVVKVEDLVERISSGKQYDNKTVKATGLVPVLDQGKSGIIGYHEDEPGVNANEDNPVIVFANHTCYQRLIHFSFSAIQNVLPFVPNKANFRNIYWLHYATKDLVEFNDYKGHWPEFMSKKLLLPEDYICKEFGAIIKPIEILIFKLERENTKLRQTRDLLLPKLMKGEIRVTN